MTLMKINMIECALAPIKQCSGLFPIKKEKVLYGIYLSSFYPIKDYGRERWIVAVNVDVDYKKHLEEGMSLEELAENCVSFLNTPPKSKYGKRRKRKSLYGIFEPKPYKVKIINKQNRSFMQLLLIIDEAKRKCFWGKGIRVLSKR